MFKINEYLTITEAAKLLGITPTTLRNWEKNKKLVPYRNPVNSFRLYKKKELLHMLHGIERKLPTTDGCGTAEQGE